MKKNIKLSAMAIYAFAIVSLAGAGMACSSCSSKVEPTQLDEQTLATKSIICGHVRYIYKDNTGAVKTPESPKPGQQVLIFYGLPDADGNVEYACKTVTTQGQDGYFETTLGCPVGKALRVKAECTLVEETYGRNEKGDYISTDAYFYGMVEKSVDCGKAEYFKLDLVPTASVTEPGLTL